MTSVPPRWRAFAARVERCRSDDERDLMRTYSQLAVDGTAPAAWPLEVRCPRGHRICTVTLMVGDSGNPQLSPSVPPGCRPADGASIVYDVVTGDVGADTTTDQRLLFRCPKRHGRSEYVRRYRGIRADAIRAALRGETFLILGDTPTQ